MDYYSKSRPNLVVPAIRQTMDKIMNQDTDRQTISEKISGILYWIYKGYISENIFIISIIVLVIIFLLYRYYNRNPGKENTEDFKDLFQEINNQTEHLRYDTQPHFNPLYSVKEQHEPVNYPPSDIPMNIPGIGITPVKDLYGYSEHYEPLNTPQYNYNNVYTYPSLNHYNGTYNTYANAHNEDSTIPNALGYPTNFNSSTGNFVGGMTDANTSNIMDYRNILDNKNNDLVESLKLGPDYLMDVDIEPPYSND